MFNLFNLSQTQGQGGIKPVVLLILDGWGIAPASEGNAITLAKTPNWDGLVNSGAYGELIASGESVGLPANEAGNSEVGHLTLGIGREVLQSLPRIDKAIADGTFYDTTAFLDAIAKVKENNSRLHLMGLIGSGMVHSSREHFFALVELCRRQGVRNVACHLFTDGRDAPPTDGVKVLGEVEKRLTETGVGAIATLMGRWWAMDRDGHWERTKAAYEAIVEGKGKQAASAVEAAQASYAADKTDEFVEPTVISSTTSGVADGDAVIFFNFRIDRPRQLTLAFAHPDFEKLKGIDFGFVPREFGGREEGEKEQKLAGGTFQRNRVVKNLFFVTMTQYQKNLPVSEVAFPPISIQGSLPEILSQKGMKQLHLAESEKERMVAYYFDGKREEPFPGEDVVILPSPNVDSYDKRPQMSVFGLAKRFVKEMRRDQYHFAVMNFANPDMVAHSGNIKATVKALEAVDKALGMVVREITNRQGTLLVTADHGNAEELLTFPSQSFFVTTAKGTVNTEHSNNPVPLVIINQALGKRSLPRGKLADVAPTILAIMNLPIPATMTGRNLLATQ
jgi:2,3-bisphosphoglycerate-independent phosphoglycerate mutase